MKNSICKYNKNMTISNATLLTDKDKKCLIHLVKIIVKQHETFQECEYLVRMIKGYDNRVNFESITYFKSYSEAHKQYLGHIEKAMKSNYELKGCKIIKCSKYVDDEKIIKKLKLN